MGNIKVENMKERLGNIEQIRDLLFGHIISDYEQRFEDNLQRVNRIELDLSNFQTEIRDRLTQLQESLTTELRSSFSSLEKQVQYIKVTTQEQTAGLESQVREIDKKNTNKIESFHKTLTTQTNALRIDLLKTTEELQETIGGLEKRVFDEIERDLSSLKDGKISRIDLADFLFEVCLKLKGAELIPQLTPSNDRKLDSDYLLPEQSAQEFEG